MYREKNVIVLNLKLSIHRNHSYTKYKYVYLILMQIFIVKNTVITLLFYWYSHDIRAQTGNADPRTRYYIWFPRSMWNGYSDIKVKIVIKNNYLYWIWSKPLFLYKFFSC